MLLSVVVRAAQIVPTGVEYTNDTIEQAGQLQACIVTTAIISPPAPEIVNFQLLVILGTPAFKVTASEVDWAQRSSAAKRIAAADFSTAQFNHPSAFNKSITPEGQLLAVLQTPTYTVSSFERFSAVAIRYDSTAPTLVTTAFTTFNSRPDADVRDTFRTCLRTMLDSMR
jgi:hypothetical protein